jgi:LPXTG-site transpeptidase (sortase) family protein
MKTRLKFIINTFLLISGVGTVIFSVFRLANGMDNSNADRIDGQEIVVVADNTPSAQSRLDPAITGNLDQKPVSSENGAVNQPTQEIPTQTSIPKTGAKSPVSIPDQTDTFLSQSVKPAAKDAADMVIPDRIVIPSILLNAPVIVADSQKVKVGDQIFDQWVAPNQLAAGWHGNSASLAGNGNTVINGHHNEYGKVFGHLIDLQPGETIYLYSDGKVYPYIISNKMILKEKNTNLQTRLQNASWIQPTTDKRLTLITCWPPESNTHRLIIVAIPYYFSPERVFG